MCGFVGCYGHCEQQWSAVTRGLETISHRGPDRWDAFGDNTFSWAACRLAIVGGPDVPAALENEASDLRLLFNGEIYNYRALQGHLRTQHTYQTGTDTEVVLHLFEEMGTDAFVHLNGIFAFCLWHQGTLYLVRDPAGVKPLYFSIVDNGRAIVFASEIKAILCDARVDLQLNHRALITGEVFGFYLGNDTTFANIQQVPPGAYIKVENGTDGRIHLVERCYWTSSEVSGAPSRSLTEVLLSAVLRQASELPTAIFLSGGLDSSLLAALAVQIGLPDLLAVTLAPEGGSPDLQAARAVASGLRLPLIEVPVRKQEAETILPDLVLADERPNLPAAGMWLSCRALHPQIRVGLCGEGADEVFSGYPWIYPHPSLYARGLLTRYRHLLRSLPEISADMAEFNELLERWSRLDEDTLRATLYRFNLTSRLVNQHLKLVDGEAMRWSVEVRVPYLDPDVVAFAAGLTSAEHVDHGETKQALRHLARVVLPADIAGLVTSRKKATLPEAGAPLLAGIADFVAQVPASRWTTHPLRWLYRSPAELLTLDLFIYLFVLKRGRVPMGFNMGEWYRDYDSSRILSDICPPELLLRDKIYDKRTQ